MRLPLLLIVGYLLLGTLLIEGVSLGCQLLNQSSDVAVLAGALTILTTIVLSVGASIWYTKLIRQKAK